MKERLRSFIAAHRRDICALSLIAAVFGLLCWLGWGRQMAIGYDSGREAYIPMMLWSNGAFNFPLPLLVLVIFTAEIIPDAVPAADRRHIRAALALLLLLEACNFISTQVRYFSAKRFFVHGQRGSFSVFRPDNRQTVQALMDYVGQKTAPQDRVMILPENLMPNFMAAVFRKKFPAAEIITGDYAAEIFPKASFDRILFWNAFPHFQDKGAVIKKAFAELKAGGQLLIAHSMDERKAKRSLRYIIKDNDPEKFTSPVIEKYLVYDMADSKLLEDFITWSKKHYPAKHYMRCFSVTSRAMAITAGAPRNEM